MCRTIVALLLTGMLAGTATAQTDTTFSYQGQLIENGELASGNYDVDFKLWNDADIGSQVGSTFSANGLQVNDGVLNADLDFGAGAFSGNRWLEIIVNGVALSPRVPITHSPYSIQTRGIFVDDAGNVGMGTTSPSSRLHLRNNGPEIALRMKSEGSWTAELKQTNASILSLINGGSERLTIDPTGKVGIGTTSPAARLDVAGDARMSGNLTAGSSSARIGKHPDLSDSWAVFWYEGGPPALSTTQSGNLFLNAPGSNLGLQSGGEDFLRYNPVGQKVTLAHGVLELGFTTLREGMSTSSSFFPETDDELSLGGSSLRWKNVYATNGTIQTSDARLKREIEEIPYGVQDVMRLDPVAYRWRNDPDSPRKLGLLAQDVLRVIPEVVVAGQTGDADIAADPDEPLGMLYAELIPVLVKSIQQQQQLIRRLEHRIETLESSGGQ